MMDNWQLLFAMQHLDRQAFEKLRRRIRKNLKKNFLEAFDMLCSCVRKFMRVRHAEIRRLNNFQYLNFKKFEIQLEFGHFLIENDFLLNEYV